MSLCRKPVGNKKPDADCASCCTSLDVNKTSPAFYLVFVSRNRRNRRSTAIECFCNLLLSAGRRLDRRERSPNLWFISAEHGKVESGLNPDFPSLPSFLVFKFSKRWDLLETHQSVSLFLEGSYRMNATTPSPLGSYPQSAAYGLFSQQYHPSTVGSRSWVALLSSSMKQNIFLNKWPR
jgi:hypothetical protein